MMSVIPGHTLRTAREKNEEVRVRTIRERRGGCFYSGRPGKPFLIPSEESPERGNYSVRERTHHKSHLLLAELFLKNSYVEVLSPGPPEWTASGDEALKVVTLKGGVSLTGVLIRRGG